MSAGSFKRISLTSTACSRAQGILGDIPEVLRLSASRAVATTDTAGVHLLRGSDFQIAADALKEKGN